MIKNIPTKELAGFLGSTQGWVSNIKSGYRKLPAKDCMRVSDRFRIPLHELRPDIFPPSTDSKPIPKNEELNQPSQENLRPRKPGRRRSDDRRGVNN